MTRRATNQCFPNRPAAGVGHGSRVERRCARLQRGLHRSVFRQRRARVGAGREIQVLAVGIEHRRARIAHAVGDLAHLAKRLAPFKLVRLTLQEENGLSGCLPDFPSSVEVIEQENSRLVLRVDRDQAPALTAHWLNTLPVADLAVEDPPIEAVIDQVYQGGVNL